MEELINELIKKLVTNGVAEFHKDGLDIKASCKDGMFSIESSFNNIDQDLPKKMSKEETAKETLKRFENYIKKLSDDFFVEIMETFEPKQIASIQKGLNSKDIFEIEDSIKLFKNRINEVASKKLEEINNDIEETETELQKLTDIRDSYLHVIQYEI